MFALNLVTKVLFDISVTMMALSGVGTRWPGVGQSENSD
jgi:hypothetical protein